MRTGTPTVLHALSRLRRDGWTGLGMQALRKGARAAIEKWGLSEPDFPLREEDITDPAGLEQNHRSSGKTGPLVIGWVCTPPGPGSGGHTTFFRMVKAMEDSGHRCILFLYDRNDDDVSRHESLVRRHWPMLRAEIRSATRGMDGVDALVASSWSSAHVLAARSPQNVHRFYFIQDYEPYFYPRGALYALAEDSYRFGLTTIALGGMIGAVLKTELGQLPVATVPFGCDTETYHLIQDGHPRTGVVFYAKKRVDRRGYLMGKMALEEFHTLMPDQEIHVYGDTVSGWNIPVTNHGNLPPRQLNVLYNRTIAGLTISFTNVSLVPGELLAAGNVPVLNESSFSAQVLSDPDAVWAPASPGRLALALAATVSEPDIEKRAQRIAQRSRQDWSSSQAAFTSVVESACAHRQEWELT
ncbi:glycosyltransferase family 1 protein [Paenarthrobacter nitroguajacolicus]|uniref:glycosyltransferase family 1 protein n=1 Tax=Paenarthrobacter nitroguajacolicus TaxID=211146 RepID=UPI003AE6F9B5